MQYKICFKMSGARNEERVEEGNRQMKIRKYTKNRSWRAFDILYGGAKERPAWKTKRIIGKKEKSERGRLRGAGFDRFTQ